MQYQKRKYLIFHNGSVLRLFKIIPRKRLTINLVIKARLFKCSICSNILPWRERPNLRCSGKNVEIDKRGNVKWKHQVETEWDFVNGNNSELLKLVSEHKSYKLIYWKLWGLINVYKCPKCDQNFQVLLTVFYGHFWLPVNIVLKSHMSPLR